MKWNVKVSKKNDVMLTCVKDYEALSDLDVSPCVA